MRRLAPLTIAALLSLCGSAVASTADVTVGPGISYSPPSTQIAAGDSVLWTWSGLQLSHSVTADDGSFDSGVGTGAAPAKTLDQQFTTPGSFTYYCTVHGHAMTGTVNVSGVAGKVVGDSDGSGTVSGSDDPVNHVTVELRTNADVFIDSRITGPDGRFVFDNPGTGDYKLHIASGIATWVTLS